MKIITVLLILAFIIFFLKRTWCEYKEATKGKSEWGVVSILILSDLILMGMLITSLFEQSLIVVNYDNVEGVNLLFFLILLLFFLYM